MKALILFTVHIIANIYYLSFPVEIKRSQEIWHGITTYQDLFSAFFYGGNFILLGIFILLPLKSTLDLQYKTIEGVFTLCLGLIYVLNYLNIYQTNYSERMWILLFFLLVVTLMVVISALRHHYFRKNKYESNVGSHP